MSPEINPNQNEINENHEKCEKTRKVEKREVLKTTSNWFVFEQMLMKYTRALR